MIIKLNTQRLNKLADKIVYNGAVKSYYEEGIDRLDTSKIFKSILKNIKSLNSEEQDYLDLAISVRSDQALTNMRIILREELEPIKNDIAQIKKVVGCNGDS